MYRGKIFGIGFHKTGTTSLARALDILGYRVTGSFGLMDRDLPAVVYDHALRLVAQYDAFQDNPWPLLYREMDEQFPGSKFILTIRPTEQWIQSVVRHFGGRTTQMRRWIYGEGDPLGAEALYTARYEKHNADVLAYFAERPGDLLVIDYGQEVQWGGLCAFLGADIPAGRYPHENSAGSRSKLSNRLKYRMRQLLNVGA